MSPGQDVLYFVEGWAWAWAWACVGGNSPLRREGERKGRESVDRSTVARGRTNVL